MEKRRRPVSRAKNVDRYKLDIEQAKLMSGKLSNNSHSKDDVNIAFQGLEDAKKLKRKGQLSEALNLYELSIELMLKILRSSPNHKELLTVQVKSALSEAESLKSSIPEEKKTFSIGNKTKQSTFEKMTSILSTAISKVDTPLQTTNSQTNISPKTTNQQQNPIKQPPFRKNSIVNSNKPNQRTHTDLKRSRLDYKDPLVQQVKLELYVDSKELQKTEWNDIAGLSQAKQAIQESAILPMIRPDLFQGLRKPQNILLYGPPGTGKTMLVKAAANESKSLLFACSPSTLTSKWHGEGEKLIRVLFQMARDVAPSLIFMDEMDALLSNRSEQEHEASRRFKTEFMVQMDGIAGDSNNAGNTVVIGCTNCPWDIDDAILRRFTRRIYIPLPDVEARSVLFTNLLKKAGNHSVTPRQAKLLVNQLDGYSGSDISAIASEASFGPIRSLGIEALQKVQEQELRPVSKGDFEKAIIGSSKSVSPSLLRRYGEWEKE